MNREALHELNKWEIDCIRKHEYLKAKKISSLYFKMFDRQLEHDAKKKR